VSFSFDPQRIAGILALLALVAYATFRIDYYLFYDRFGLSPEDVGLGYSEGVVQTALISLLAAAALVLLAIGALFAVFALVSLLFGFGFLAYWVFHPVVWLASKLPGTPWDLLVRFDARAKKDGSVAWSDVRTRLGNKWVRLGALVGVALAVWCFLGYASFTAAGRLKSGHRPGVMHYPLDFLDIGAQRLRIHWTSAGGVERTILPQGACVVYLGSGSGTVFVHRFQTTLHSGRDLPPATLRVPAADALLTGRVC
jgi:hypothetical protein